MQHTFFKYHPSIWKVTGLLLLLFVLPASAIREHKTEIDSLNRILSEHPSPCRSIPVLSRLAKLHEQKPEQVVYLKEQIKEAEKIDSIQAVYAALSEISVYYYNMKNGSDSLTYWVQQIDSITHKRNEYPDVLFRAKSLYCQDLLWSGNYEESMNRITDLYQLAVEKKQNYGLMRCSECLGQIYQAIRRDSDAVVAFQDGLDRLEQLGGDEETELRLISYQIESNLRTDAYEKTAGMLAAYKKLIDKLNELNATNNSLYVVDREYWLLYSFYTDLYLQENKLDKAKEALEMATRFEGCEFVEGDYACRVYLAVKSRYYTQTGNLSTALYYIDKLLEEKRLPEVLQLKADILKKQGKQDEILALYDEIDTYNTKRNSEMFLRQVNQLRTLHDINFEIVLKEKIKNNQKQISQEHYQLIFFISLIIILIIILYILYIYIRRTQRLKNDLLQEKDTLLESKEKLILETMRADEASYMKSSFIADMSHEIRTPLNAIAGFSELLIDEATESKEKKEYSAIIQNNTDLMLTLVNDVLDLSKMKTGDMSFNLQKVPLAECCQKALDSIRQSVREGVALTFNPAPEQVIIKTDAMRLQQLLTNLLANAIKFTEKGEINLAYSLEADRKQVRITVTDTGTGVPPEIQEEIFKRLKKQDDSRAGTGLGLPICYYIAEHLSGPGKIFLDTSYTAGARFVFIHPCETDVPVI